MAVEASLVVRLSQIKNPGQTEDIDLKRPSSPQLYTAADEDGRAFEAGRRIRRRVVASEGGFI